ncbi:2-dehydropantoate 2-reductase [Flavobacterium sp. Fl-318]|uniref:2-dehydropantoate 2-reductase n=1 Tax=Flavobacterium cupriresistens TaxID=2893885 RepID=A0ABU4RIW2_9FLAO|nr:MULTISPECIES: 2-dehydropantoate 2-reductase [unclassified Flavobacterium]MDX6191883.1 2-dehydropantoate 2-reductase [Flavobacterium sp. Fl-318]UFH41859.1 2-dehydropantoate 2-reductase [Flavobacterium sp. F-323]
MKTRIGILGLGGVGGYFGGLLAKAYQDSEEIEIVFIARGETLRVVAESGLKIITKESETVVFPKVVSNDPELIGKLDYLICATKTYDIEESLLALKKCITKNTVILPLYNGVDAPERISALFPDNEVLEGCVYIFSMIVSPGVVQNVGSLQRLLFGSYSVSVSKMKALQTIFKNALIDSHLVENIEDAVWEKFVFISVLASATCYLDYNIGQILENREARNIYVSLMNEITMIAAVKGLNLPDDIIMQTILKLEKTPPDTTSSMHRDLLAGRNIELASLTQFVVDEGLKYEVETPTYQLVLDKLSNLMN